MKISGKSHILEELERLKAIHGGSKVQSTLFQPDETQQRKLIIGNAATKIVSLSMKRECMKYVYHQKMKIEEEMRRNECQDGTESVNSEQTTETISHHAQHNAKKTNSGRGKSSQQRKKNGGSNRTYSSGIGSSTMIKFDISDRMLSKHIKPRVKSGGTLGRTTSLITTLSSNISTDDIIREIHQQAAEQLRDAKSIFECIVRSFDSGKICQFHPKRLFEDLDVSLYSTNTMSISNVTKLEDLSQMKKKDGILLIFDPSTDTQLHLATLKVSYMKSLDLNNEVEVSKEFTFWSNGNYYGLKFMREFVKSTKQSNRAYAPPLLNKGATPPRAFISRAVSSSSFVGDGVDEGSSSPVGSLSKANSQRYQSYNQSFAEEPTGDDFDQENTLLEDEDMNERSPNANLQAVYQFGGTDKCSLPGWNGRSALFIPAMKCRLEIINVKDLSRKAAVANNLSRLRLYGVCCPNPKVGIKKVLEFLEYQVLQDAANVTLPGGLSALNISAFHGNFEAVQQLVSSGVDVDQRCKEDQHCTALHVAVIGGHFEIVKFLLAQGANQLLKDDSGSCPLHYACRLGQITTARILMDGPGGKRALVMTNHADQKPIDNASNYFLKATVEAVMRKHRIFVQPRVSLMDRTV